VNRDLISFFDSLKYDDTSIILSNEFQNQDYFRLSRRLQNVNRQILNLKEKNIQKDIYFKIVTEHATVGLLGFDEKGNVKLCNKAFRELFEIESLTKISKLNTINPNFESIVSTIEPSDHKLLKVEYDNQIKQLVIRATYFKSKDQNLKLISVQDIKNELDQNELESWQKLVQILRHEIMNSIGPISSTIDTLNEIITNPKTNETRKIKDLDNEMLSDISSGLKIIKERNVGIQEFTEKFRSLSRIPKPEINKVSISELFSNIQLLWENELKKKNISLETSIKDNIEYFFADKNQIEQILINLIKNSIESIDTTPNGNIKLTAHYNKDKKISIDLTDTGKGISNEISDKIFIPFFTTKEQGSGIGLNLARQIMRLHGGNITMQSIPEKETTFTLTF